MLNLRTTLLYIVKDNKVLLAEKKRGFGVGKINGVGGKIEPGESIEQGMIRETFEEINVKPINYEQRAVIHFSLFYKGEWAKEDTYVFVASDYQGIIQESEEMKPQWFNIDEIPFDKMFSGDKLWVGELLKGKHFEAFVDFDKDFNTKSFDIKFDDEK